MKLILALSAPILSLTAMLFSSCASSTPVGNSGSGSAYLADYRTNPAQPGVVTQPAAFERDMGYWDGDGVGGSPLIKVNIAKQTAYFYKGNQLVGQTPISTGKEGKITPKGTYKVTQKSKDHKSSLYGVIKDNATGAIINAKADSRKDRAKAGQTFENVPMPNFLRFNGPIGMHAGHLPGYPASAGCVRLPENMSEHFFNSSNLGTIVIVE